MQVKGKVGAVNLAGTGQGMSSVQIEFEGKQVVGEDRMIISCPKAMALELAAMQGEVTVTVEAAQA